MKVIQHNPGKLLTIVIFTYLLIGEVQAIARDTICLKNTVVSLKFAAKNGAFISMEDLYTGNTVFNSKRSANNSPWEIFLAQNGVDRVFDINDFRKFTYEMSDSRTLVLSWEDMKGVTDLSIKASIMLEDNNPLSSWHIAVTGLQGKTLSKVVFPKISGLSDLGEEYLAVPHYLGALFKDPRNHLASQKTRKLVWDYPGHLSMQFLSWYSKENRGFYASCNDGANYAKNFSLKLDAAQDIVYQMENFPSQDVSVNDYNLTYNAVLGPFEGDWMTAAAIYAKWGEQQKWAKESRLRNGLTPDWLENTGLWIWNRGRSDQVLTPAVELRKELELPVNVLWHWWHGGSYDDSFPGYLPPRDGNDLFIEKVNWAQQQGVNTIVYMNQLQWGTSTTSWKRENASLSAVKNKNGKMNTTTYNIFTGKSLTNMCIGTTFWKKKYISLADSVLNHYSLNGIYMDQACLSRLCYDASHGLGGGNYWVSHSGILTSGIRNVSKARPIALTGEGISESWMAHLDAFLALQVSRERYGGVQGGEPIPMFQAVYHPYAISFGNYSSLLSPPYDEMWPDEHRPVQTLQPLDTMFNKQFLLEQARSFVWGYQPMIANYKHSLALERKPEIDYMLNLVKIRHQSLKYLLHGKFLRPPALIVPSETLKICKLSIYAGQKDKVTTQEKTFPTIYTSAWKSDDNMVGIALASISDSSYQVDMGIKTADYEIPGSGKLYMIDNGGKKLFLSYSDGYIKINFVLPRRGTCVLEVVPDE